MWHKPREICSISCAKSVWLITPYRHIASDNTQKKRGRERGGEVERERGREGRREEGEGGARMKTDYLIYSTNR